MSYQLLNEDYLKLWMYFQDRADNIKEAMFKTITWTIGFTAAIIGFIFYNLTNFERSKASIKLPVLIILSSIAGVVICLYSLFIIFESKKHISSNWGRANRCRKRIKDFNDIYISTLKKKKAKKKKIMNICNQLGIIVVLFVISFLTILIWQLIIL